MHKTQSKGALQWAALGVVALGLSWGKTQPAQALSFRETPAITIANIEDITTSVQPGSTKLSGGPSYQGSGVFAVGKMPGTADLGIVKTAAPSGETVGSGFGSFALWATFMAIIMQLVDNGGGGAVEQAVAAEGGQAPGAGNPHPGGPDGPGGKPPEPIPTPALLPGLVGIGAGIWRRHSATTRA